MRRIAALALLLLAGCQGSFAVGGMTLDDVRATSTADLQNAHAKAVAVGDEQGAKCWEALMPIPSPKGATTGVASALEDGRILAMALFGPCGGIAKPLLALGGGL